jgi:photosystem II stability/assembly factor-like uncharacterized protein
MKTFRILLVASLWWCGTHAGLAQTWTLTGASTNLGWGCIACSADGTKQVAAGNDIGIWVSTNSGSTWTMTSAPNTNDWEAVAASADGTRLVAMDGHYGVIYASTDSGTTWTKKNVPDWTWRSITLSADGTRMAASAVDPAFNEYVVTSADSGATWTSNSLPGSSAVYVATSPDGSRLLAASGEGYILTSTNSGVTWQSVASGILYLHSVAFSASGATLVVGCEGYILVSTNSGATWNSNSVSAFGNLAIVSLCASSADGTALAAVAGSAIVGYRGASVIVISTNSGTAWIPADAPVKIWTGVACSADGGKWVGSTSYSPFAPFPSAQVGGIYRSQTTPSPQLSLTPSGSNLTASWIVPSTNFVLQQSPDLSSWINVTDTPVLNLTNLQDEVVLSPTNRSGFYRLKTP